MSVPFLSRPRFLRTILRSMPGVVLLMQTTAAEKTPAQPAPVIDGLVPSCIAPRKDGTCYLQIKTAAAAAVKERTGNKTVANKVAPAVGHAVANAVKNGYRTDFVLEATARGLDKVGTSGKKTNEEAPDIFTSSTKTQHPTQNPK